MTVPRRSDARRNRAAILRAATEAFTRGGEIVPLGQIARLAGVGQATVYRHFPDRRALVVAVIGEQLALLARAVRDGAGEPAAFRALLRAVLLAQATMRPLITLLRQLPARDQQRYVEQLITVLSGPFRRSQEAGLLRHDVELGDLVIILAMMETALETVTDRAGRDAAVRRVIDVVLDGFFLPLPARTPRPGRGPDASGAPGGDVTAG